MGRVNLLDVPPSCMRTCHYLNKPASMQAQAQACSMGMQAPHIAAQSPLLLLHAVLPHHPSHWSRKSSIHLKGSP